MVRAPMNTRGRQSRTTGECNALFRFMTARIFTLRSSGAIPGEGADAKRLLSRIWDSLEMTRRATSFSILCSMII
jgi:hypothetical protein